MVPTYVTSWPMTYSMAYGYRWFMNVYDILLPPTYHWEIFRIQLVEVRKRTMFWHVLACSGQNPVGIFPEI